MLRDFLDKNNLPYENRRKFIQSIEKLKNEKVEIFLGNHLENNKTEEKLEILEKNGYEENPFIKNSREEWEAFLEERMLKIKRIIDENL